MKNEDTNILQEREHQNKIECRVVSSIEKVFPKKRPDVRTSDLSGLRGETVSFQIAYLWNGSNKLLGEVSEISVYSDHMGESGTPFSKEDIRIRKVMLVPCTYTSHKKVDEDYLATEPGVYPDLLQNLDEYGFPVIAGQWRSLWIDLNIPKNAVAGTYQIAFLLKSNDKSNRQESFCEQVTIRFEVIGAELPDLDIPHTEWLHCDCLADYYQVPVFSEEHWTIIEQFVMTAVKRGCNMLYTPVFTPPLDTAVGAERKTVQLIDVYMDEASPSDETKYLFGFQRLERWVQMGQRCGIRYYEISHLYTQWGATAAPKVIVTVNGEEKKIFGWQTKACGKAYRNFLFQFLTALDQELCRLGIQKQVYFHISDEPTKEQLDTYRNAKEQISELLKGYHTIDAVSNYEFYENGLIEEPVCASDHIATFLESQKRPERLWVYYCTVQSLQVSNRFIVMPGSRTRLIGNMIYKHNIDGFLHWGFNFYNSQYSLYPIDPYKVTDADGAFPAGDPFLVYPGKDGIPEESIRMMLMDEAFADYRALRLLEKITNREQALKCLEEDTFGELTFDCYPKERTYVDHIREKINQKIKEAAEGELE